MHRARMLVLLLLALAFGVGIVTPIVLDQAAQVRGDAAETRGPVLDVLRAVALEQAALTSRFDEFGDLGAQIDEFGDFGAQEVADDVSAYLAAETAEAEAFALLERRLASAGANQFLEPFAARRAEFELVLADLAEQFTGNGIAPELRAETTSRAYALATAVEADYDALATRVDRELVEPRLAAMESGASRLWTIAAAGLGSLVVVLLGGAAATLARSRRTRARLSLADAERDRLSRHARFESTLMRGLEMAKSELAVFDLVQQAIGESAPGHGAELLMADSSQAHFSRVLTVGDIGEGCGVVEPLDCPASARGQTTVFPDDSAIDTCPHLRGRGCSAICVPVSVAGRGTGVVHVIGPVGNPPHGDAEIALQVVARRASERIAMVRAFEQTSARANTDSLTGLANRRSLEDRLREEQRSGDPYSVAYCDLDHFKTLNDLYGHETGDRALRLFSRVLRDAVRPSDVACRYGGEEFVLLLPRCDSNEAKVVLERVREQLASALAAATVPAFTCSFGLATSNDGAPPDQVIAAADAALLMAKATGRDRIVHATGDGPVSSHAAALSALDLDLAVTADDSR